MFISWLKAFQLDHLDDLPEFVLKILILAGKVLLISEVLNYFRVSCCFPQS